MWKGILFCLGAGLAASLLAGIQNVIGAPIIGLFLGLLFSNVLPAGFSRAVSSGAGFSSKRLLKVAIILAGGTLSFTSIVGVGVGALPIIIFNICWSFFVALIIGRWMNVSSNTSVLVGGGTAICGGTAIATLSSVVDAKEDETAYAITAIFLFDIFAALMWPYAAQAMNFSPAQYGILGGLAISDTSSVTAAGSTFDALMGATAGGMTGGEMAVVVKLTRTVMLVFVTIAVMLVQSFHSKAREKKERTGSYVNRALKSFPLFVVGFLVMALLNTLIDFSSIDFGAITLSRCLSKAYKYLIAVALVGVGCKIKIRDMFTKGVKPILLGGCTWLAVALSTLGYILVFVD